MVERYNKIVKEGKADPRPSAKRQEPPTLTKQSSDQLLDVVSDNNHIEDMLDLDGLILGPTPPTSVPVEPSTSQVARPEVSVDDLLNGDLDTTNHNHTPGPSTSLDQTRLMTQIQMMQRSPHEIAMEKQKNSRQKGLEVSTVMILVSQTCQYPDTPRNWIFLARVPSSRS